MYFLSLLLLLPSASAAAAAALASDPRLQCWFRGGSPEGEGVPCNRTAALAGLATPCCKSGHVCTSKGLCIDPVQNDVYTWSCSAKAGSAGSLGCGPDICSTDTAKQIQTCDPINKVACCMKRDETCCNDTSVVKINNFGLGSITFVLDKAGRNLLGQSADENTGAVFFNDAPQPQTGLAPVNSTNTCPSNSAPTGQLDAEIKNLKTALLGVGVTLGILLAASIAAAVFLFVKWTAEKRKPPAPMPPAYEKDEEPIPDVRGGWVPGTRAHEMFAGQPGPFEAGGTGR